MTNKSERVLLDNFQILTLLSVYETESKTLQMIHQVEELKFGQKSSHSSIIQSSIHEITVKELSLRNDRGGPQKTNK